MANTKLKENETVLNIVIDKEVKQLAKGHAGTKGMLFKAYVELALRKQIAKDEANKKGNGAEV